MTAYLKGLPLYQLRLPARMLHVLRCCSPALQVLLLWRQTVRLLQRHWPVNSIQ